MKTEIDDADRAMSNLQEELSHLQESLQEQYDKLSDKAKEGEKGEALQEQINEVEATCDALADLIGKIPVIEEWLS